MTYLLKDDDGDIYGAVANVGLVDIQKAQCAVDRACNIPYEVLRDEAQSLYELAGTKLELNGVAGARPYDWGSKAALVYTYLIEKCEGTALDFEVWRCGL